MSSLRRRNKLYLQRALTLRRGNKAFKCVRTFSHYFFVIYASRNADYILFCSWILVSHWQTQSQNLAFRCFDLRGVFKKQLRYFLCLQNITPSFLEIESMIAKTNFTLGSIEEKKKLSRFNGPLLPWIDHSKGRGNHQSSNKVPLSKLS